MSTEPTVPHPQPLGPRGGNPPLTRWQLTWLLFALALVPSVATVGMYLLMPGVQEGELAVEYQISGVPTADYFQLPAEKRPPLSDARITITNRGQRTWDVLNIVINKGYEIRDPESELPPGESKAYQLDQFYNRSGFTFHPELSPVTHLRFFARVGKTSRQSYQTSIKESDYNRPNRSPAAQEMVAGEPVAQSASSRSMAPK